MAARVFTLPLFQSSFVRRNERALQLKLHSVITVSTAGAHVRPRFQANNIGCEEGSPEVVLQKGVLIEFKKDSGKVVVGVTQKREGKRNWSVIDQNADTYIVKPNQIRLVVPGTDNYSPHNVSGFLEEVELLQDPTLLEIAWEEMLLNERTADIIELASILYGSTAPEKCYSAYRLLASNPVYFKCKEDGYLPKYEPRTLAQVRELQLKQMQEEITRRKLLEFVDHVNALMELPSGRRPTKASWDGKDEFQAYLESLKLYALEKCTSPETKNMALQVLEALKVNKTPNSAVNLLFQIGYFHEHENLHLLKLELPMSFSAEALTEADAIKAMPVYDVDEDRRVDLTSLKVYTIDGENPDEIDDGLSAVRLPDGRLRVWIHIADPTRWIKWKTILQKEASQRCTSIFLPTMTIPMLPEELSIDLMSLRQGQCCSSVSVSITLSPDGSIADKAIENSIVSPTYGLSYDAALELLSMGLEEEESLSVLYEAALLRQNWRRCNGALDAFLPSVKVSVKDEQTTHPEIKVILVDQKSPSVVLVREMMLLCGEVVAAFGDEHGICLPYRGQKVNEDLKAGLVSIPDGPARALASLRCMLPAEMGFMRPLQHACLGLDGYVQFTSPLRRFTDFLVHYQLKAVLRNEKPPIQSAYMETSMAAINNKNKVLKKLHMESDRYWILEYLRREPSDRRYHACLLSFEKDASAVVMLTEVALQNQMELRTQRTIGDVFFVRVVDSQPRKSFLVIREV